MSSTAATSSGIMEKILRLMTEKKASDVYLSAHAPALIRISGKCIPINNQILGKEAPKALLAEILSTEQMHSLDSTCELNIGFSFGEIGRFRISAMKQRGTVAVVIRYIEKEIPWLETLNLPKVLADLSLASRGLILVVGAAGSGKSTTVASMLDWRNRHQSGHILTFEDPIEYFFENKKSLINQREIGTDCQSLDEALKNAMRQAPDVIYLGEILDGKSMSNAMAYAQSGHLCLATLHANNSYQALNRIVNFYPLEARNTILSDVANGLKAIISQRLLSNKVGGRVPATEVLINTQLISEYIAKGDLMGIRDALDKTVNEGSQSFESAISNLIKLSIIDKKEGLLHADSTTNLAWRLENDFSQAAAPTKAQTDHQEDDNEGPTFTEIILTVGKT